MAGEGDAGGEGGGRFQNARRRLQSASHEVLRDLEVTSSVARKHRLEALLPLLQRMAHTVDTRARLEATVADGNFAKALRMCSDCLMLVEECSQLQAVAAMNCSIEEWLTRTVERVDALLQEACRTFHSDAYAKVIDAYAVMDNASSLAEKVQTFFAQSVVAETYDVLRLFYYQASQEADPALVQRRGRLPYSDLCHHLPPSHFLPCLEKTYEMLFRVMHAYHTMMTWQHPKAAQAQHPEGEKEGEEGAVGLEEEAEGREGSGAEQLARQMRGDTTAAVRRSLERGRKTVWELASRRAATLLSSDALVATSATHFMQVLECTRIFILGGEQFSGAQAHGLRAKAQRQSEKYFVVFHRQNLEVLRNVFERETWQRLPPLTIHSLHLAVLTGKGVAPPSHCALLPASHGPPPTPAEQATFTEAMAKGNLFGAGEKKDAATPVVERRGTGEKEEEEEEEEEREELLAECIDEEGSLAPGHSGLNGGVGDVAILTGSAVSVLRYMERYVRLMRVLQPVAAEVLKGMLHLFDLYLLSIFRLFGQREAIATPGSSESNMLFYEGVGAWVGRV